MSPLPDTITALGVSEENAPLVQSGATLLDNNSYALALELQRELLAIAGWPDCREAYEETCARLSLGLPCLELLEHPERGGQGTGAIRRLAPSN